MTNFDYLKQEPKFNSFSDVAVAAEKVLKIDMESSVINCRRAMEFAIKWMYSVDWSLEMPYQDSLVSLMSTEDFHDLVDDDLWKRLDLSVLREPPFTDRGSVAEVFTDLTVWMGIKKVIDRINDNAAA